MKLNRTLRVGVAAVCVTGVSIAIPAAASAAPIEAPIPVVPIVLPIAVGGLGGGFHLSGDPAAAGPADASAGTSTKNQTVTLSPGQYPVQSRTGSVAVPAPTGSAVAIACLAAVLAALAAGCRIAVRRVNVG